MSLGGLIKILLVLFFYFSSLITHILLIYNYIDSLKNTNEILRVEFIVSKS